MKLADITPDEKQLYLLLSRILASNTLSEANAATVGSLFQAGVGALAGGKVSFPAEATLALELMVPAARDGNIEANLNKLADIAGQYETRLADVPQWWQSFINAAHAQNIISPQDLIAEVSKDIWPQTAHPTPAQPTQTAPQPTQADADYNQNALKQMTTQDQTDTEKLKQQVGVDSQSLRQDLSKVQKDRQATSDRLTQLRSQLAQMQGVPNESVQLIATLVLNDNRVLRAAGITEGMLGGIRNAVSNASNMLAYNNYGANTLSGVTNKQTNLKAAKLAALIIAQRIQQKFSQTLLNAQLNPREVLKYYKLIKDLKAKGMTNAHDLKLQAARMGVNFEELKQSLTAASRLFQSQP